MPEKLRGIYSIDLSAKEHQDIIKNTRRKSETPMAAAMPCKDRVREQAYGKPLFQKKQEKPKHLKQRQESVVLTLQEKDIELQLCARIRSDALHLIFL